MSTLDSSKTSQGLCPKESNTIYLFLFSEVSLNPQGLAPVSVLSPFSHVQLFATLWTVAHQAPLSTGFSRQEYWSGLPFPSPGDLPDPGIEPTSFMPLTLAGGFFTTSTTWKARPSQSRPFNFKVINARMLELCLHPWKSP